MDITIKKKRISILPSNHKQQLISNNYAVKFKPNARNLLEENNGKVLSTLSFVKNFLK